MEPAGEAASRSSNNVNAAYQKPSDKDMLIPEINEAGVKDTKNVILQTSGKLTVRQKMNP